MFQLFKQPEVLAALVVILGTIALLFLGIALSALVKHQYTKCLISSIFGILSICISSGCWVILIGASGKNTAFLGFERYPFVIFLVLGIVFMCVICAALSVRYARSQKSQHNNSK